MVNSVQINIGYACPPDTKGSGEGVRVRVEIIIRRENCKKWALSHRRDFERTRDLVDDAREVDRDDGAYLTACTNS